MGSPIPLGELMPPAMNPVGVPRPVQHECGYKTLPGGKVFVVERRKKFSYTPPARGDLSEGASSGTVRTPAPGNER